MKVVLVKPGKYPQITEIEPGLESYQKIVGGYIQAVYPFENPVALICNEEGKLTDLTLNRALKDENGQVYGIVAGDFFICGLGEEDFCDLTDELAEIYSGVFHFPETFTQYFDGSNKTWAIEAVDHQEEF